MRTEREREKYLDVNYSPIRQELKEVLHLERKRITMEKNMQILY